MTSNYWDYILEMMFTNCLWQWFMKIDSYQQQIPLTNILSMLEYLGENRMYWGAFLLKGKRNNNKLVSFDRNSEVIHKNVHFFIILS